MRTFLILPLVFGALLLIPSVGAVYGGTAPPTLPIFATTTWVGMEDDESWSDPDNWDRQFGPAATTIGFNHALPELCDFVIIDGGSFNAVTVHFDLSSFQLGNEMHIGSGDTFIIDSGRTFDHTPTLGCQILNQAAETIVNNGNFQVFGTLINNGAFINNGAVLNCGSISGSVFPLPGIVNPCPVGGELIPLDTTSLIVVGAQMNAAWMIPVIVSAIGIGIVLARKF